MSDRTFLEEITIRSIGVIEHSTLEISKGLTVLTGETGAGKTMILTALNLILGGKSDSALVRKGSERLVASGRFSVPPELSEVFDEAGLSIEDGELILTRSVNSDGKSKAMCNSITVPASALLAASENLVEVHAQAANLNMTKAAKQRDLLDRFGGAPLKKSLSNYQEALSSYHDLKNRISAMKKSIDSREAQLSALREFASVMQKLNLVRGETAEITSEIARLSSVEELRLAAQSATSVLEEEESGSLTTIGIIRKSLDSVRTKDPIIEDLYQRVSEAFFLIDDVKISLASYMANLEADPSRLDYLNSRKAHINEVIKKYGGSASADEELATLIERFEGSKSAIADLEGGDERLKELETELITVKKSLVASAQSLTKVRSENANILGKKTTVEIAQLSMPHTTFHCVVESADYAALKESDFTVFGCDEISMLIQAHKDAPLVQLAKGASGGEMSRVMLALEVVLAASHPVGTYVFDEVDAGVGGKAAIEVGRRLHALSQHAQVIVVTHLPQVAAWADSHFVVTKNSDGSVTESNVVKVSKKERIEEIARMLAGMESSLSAREHATELLALPLSSR
ncbi:MAG: DNA repair protein RecN [Actinobacteria bacterium]|uniref:DNA repair protein RecN n=1 Tax=freshwater metagenome TaxID=449393 RepID=A0A6J6ZHC7_9ZZZZ|nr:DNA repair protein RecN [Actinomycetota bacterium]MSX71723.1 DNA repair protein RecN [Actinomycetota bacterium]MSY69297.1 DNA repair protein RecN [Actinomycetota bacterium]MTA75638.1 DNA repair protein RecN [Actinomycetota bacterium]